MPHPKNSTKLTGDTHPPDLDGSDTGTEIEDIAMDARADADAGSYGTSSTAPALAFRGDFGDFRDFGGSLRGYADAAREQVRAKPYAAIGSAFALGFVLARLFR